MVKIGIIGECMVELFDQADGTCDRSFGGDTLNTAVYLTRCSQQPVQASFVTALGDDPLSEEMLSAWHSENIDTTLVERVPGAVPGLYMIQTDEVGERSFLYWRDQAPVKRLFQTNNSQSLIQQLMKFDWLYYTGISLAVLEPEGRRRLFELFDIFRAQGGKVAFDNNYRPRLWKKLDRHKILSEAYRRCDLAMPSIDDEFLFWEDDNIDSVIRRLHSFGCSEVVVKQGEKDCIVSTNQETTLFPVEAADQVVDTTAAGDSFNGGYLAVRIQGGSIAESIAIGQKVSKQVITKSGAIVPIEL